MAKTTKLNTAPKKVVKKSKVDPALTEIPQVVQFKGKPLINLTPSEEDGFKRIQFGLRKAQAIVAYLEYIKAFVASNGKSCNVE